MTRPLDVLLVDDEPHALKRLAYDVARIPTLRLVGACDSSAEALKRIAELKPDLLLLDISMPVMTGFELIEALAPGPAPAVIFVTAHNDYATQAFDAAAIDYLLKPIAFERLARAVERAQASLSQKSEAQRMAELTALVALLKRETPDAATETAPAIELWVPHAGRMTRIRADQIERAEAERDYVRVHTAERSYLMRGTLSELERRLTAPEFARVHRSAIVRVAALQAVERRRGGGLRLTLASGVQVNVGRLYLRSVKAWLAPAMQRGLVLG